MDRRKEPELKYNALLDEIRKYDPDYIFNNPFYDYVLEISTLRTEWIFQWILMNFFSCLVSKILRLSFSLVFFWKKRKKDELLKL